jgi:hypothetical protein
MAELTTLGKFWLIDDPLLYRRMGSSSSMTRSVSQAELQLIQHPERKHFRSFGKWIQQFDFIRASLVAPVPWRQKPRFFSVGAAPDRLAARRRGARSRQLFHQIRRIRQARRLSNR